MVKINLDGCKSFVSAADYDKFAAKSLEAFDTLVSGNGAGNDFLGWKTLPCDTPEQLIKDCEAVRLTLLEAWPASVKLPRSISNV